MNTRCPVCGGETIQKSRPRLALAGCAFLAGLGLPALADWLWTPALIAGLTGLYLLYWATAGQGRWCRQCKSIRAPR